MGYRHYFYKVKKEVLHELSKYTEKDLDKYEDRYLPLMEKGETLFRFGSYYDPVREIQKTGERLFEDEVMWKLHEDYEPYIVSKEGLLVAIEYNRQQVIRNFKRLIDKEDNKKDYFNDKLQMWERGTFLNLDIDDRFRIQNSWLYEYEMFNLIHIYKSFPWDTHGILFMGW